MSNLINTINKINEHVNKFYGLLSFNNVALSKYLKVLTFLVPIFCFYLYIGVFKYIHIRPSSIHISAQTQRASIALNYYKADMNFFKPRIQRHMEGEGITGVEFPVIYYLGAIMYKLFGFNEMYLRAISLIIVTLGLYLFYLMAAKILKNNIIAIIITISGSLSPVFLFYTPNFMPDAPSMALHLGAWFFFFKYLTDNNKKTFFWFVALGVLASLIKAIAFMAFIVVGCLLVLDKLKYFKKYKNGRLIDNHFFVIKSLVIGTLVFLSWYIYASWLTNHYKYQSFALSPIMVDSWKGAMDVFIYIKNLWSQYYYSYESYVLLLVALTLVLLLMKHANRLLFTITILNLFGSLCYFYLFLNQFQHHDYYTIAILPTVFFLLLTFGEMIVRFSEKKFAAVNIIFIVVMFFNMKEGIKYCRKIYEQRNTRYIYYWAGDYRAYEDLEPKLRKARIKRTDRFISAFDESYCGSLYLMDQLGVNIGNKTTKEDIDYMVKHPNLKYLILSDSAKFNQIYPNNFKDKIILYHRGLIIYKLKN